MDLAKPLLKATMLSTPGPIQSNKAYLLTLPYEVLKMICEELVIIDSQDPTGITHMRKWKSLLALGRTCTVLQHVIQPIFYRDIADYP